MPSSAKDPDPWHASPAGLATFALAYVLSAHLTLGTIGDPGVRIEGWLPLGVYLAWLLRLPRSSWWKVIATSAVATIIGFSWARPGVGALAQVGFWAIDTAGVLVGARLWGGVFHPDRDLRDFRGIGRLIRSCLATASFTVVAAVVGTIVGGFDAPAWSTAIGFVVGTLLGMLFTAPPLLLASHDEAQLILGDWKRRAEFLVGMLLLAAWILAGAEALHGSRPEQERFLIMPFALWAAWRQGRLATSIVLLVGHVLDGTGAPFAFEGFSFDWALRALIDDVFLILFSLGLAVGISSLRRSRSELSNLASIAERTGVSILTTDTEGRITWANAAFTTNTGHAVEEAVGRKPGELLNGPDTDQGSVRRMSAAIRLGHAFSETLLNYRKDGSPFWHKIDVDPLRDERGRLLGFIGIQTDVTEAVQARETRALAEAAAAIKEEAERFRFVARGTRDLIWDWDLRTNRQYWNEAYHEFWGSDPATFRPSFEDWLPRVHHEDRPVVLATFERFRESTDSDYVQELRLLSREGDWHVFRDRCFALRDDRGQVIRMVGAMQDITEERLAQERQLATAKLEATGTLAGGLAHDFNNLLTTILLSLDNLEAERGVAPGKSIGSLPLAREAVLAARGLTDRLLSIAEGGSGTRRALDLAKLVRTTVVETAPAASMLVEYEMQEGLPPVHGNEGQLRQLVSNLVLNASEAMQQGGLLRVSLSAEGPQTGTHAHFKATHLRLVVEDGGPGVPAAIASRIFDPYFSTKPRGSDKGLGLGLTLCRSIAGRHGGTIELVPSAPGRGATFEVRLPAGVMKPGTTPIPAEPALATSAQPPRSRILVLEDEPALLRSIGTILRHQGHEPTLVGDGEAAIAAHAAGRAEGRPFDIVLLDFVVRGGSNGAEVLAELKRREPDLRAVVMSGYAHADVLGNPGAHGFAAALSKPFSAKDLAKALGDVLAKEGN